MKRILSSLMTLALVIPLNAQLIEELNLMPSDFTPNRMKGIVLSATTTRYQYKENFGEPILGDTLNRQATFYDELGRTILVRRCKFGRKLSLLNKLQCEKVESFIYEYSQQGNDLLVKVNTSDMTSRYSDLRNHSKMISSCDATFEKSFLKYYDQNRQEYTIDKNRIITKVDLYKGNELWERIWGKEQSDGSYEFTRYGKNGDVDSKTFWNFRNGLLVKLEDPSIRNIRRTGEINLPRPGTYEYDNDGNLVKFIAQENTNHITIFYYNDKGDFTHATRNNDICDIYGDYEYDSHGNWISRTFSNKKGKIEYVEKRTIVYCETKDELSEASRKLTNEIGSIIESEKQAAFAAEIQKKREQEIKDSIDNVRRQEAIKREQAELKAEKDFWSQGKK